MTDRIFAVAHLADMTVLYLLLTLSAIAVCVIGERFRFLRKLAKQSKSTLEEIEKALRAKNYAYIEKMAENENTIEGRVALSLIQHIKEMGNEGVEQLFSALVQVEKPKLERSLGFLATVGSNAPYIGLFGTVLGIMKSFNDLASSGSSGDQGSVMAGISAALIATAAGLLVAIPSVLAYNYFQKQVKLILGNLEVVRDMALTNSLYARSKHGK